MLRQASRMLVQRATAGATRQITLGAALREEATTDHAKTYLDAFEKAQGEGAFQANLVPPAFMKDWMKKAPEATTTGIADKLTFNFYMPHGVEMDNAEVDMVLVPGKDGDFGILPGHVPTVSQLRPGVISVTTGTETSKYFVSSGFAFVHANSQAEVCAVEAVPLDQLDGEAVKASLNEYNTALVNAKDDYEKAAAQIGIEVTSAMSSALGN